MVKGILAAGAPVEDGVFPGQGMQGSGDSCGILHIPPVIPGETEERADFGGGFGRRDLLNGCEECRVREEAFLGDPVTQVADLFGGECTFRLVCLNPSKTCRSRARCSSQVEEKTMISSR